MTNSIAVTDVESLSQLANSSGKGWPDDAFPSPYSFKRNVTLRLNVRNPTRWNRNCRNHRDDEPHFGPAKDSARRLDQVGRFPRWQLHSFKGDLNGFFRAQIKNPRAWATTGAQTVSMIG